MFDTQVYHPQCKAVDQPFKIAFFETAHYKALASSERINHGENLNISSQKRVKKQGGGVGAKAQSTPEYKGDH